MSLIEPPITTIPNSQGGPYPWSSYGYTSPSVFGVGPGKWVLVSQFADANYKYLAWRVITLDTTGAPQASAFKYINLTTAPWPATYSTFPYTLSPFYHVDPEGNVWLVGENNPFPSQPVPSGPQGSGAQYNTYGGGPGAVFYLNGNPTYNYWPNTLPISGTGVDGGQHKGPGNVLICITSCHQGSFDTPPGYTFFIDYLIPGTEYVNSTDPAPSTGATYIQVFYRITDGTETTGTITFTGSAAYPAAILMYCTGVDPNNPFGTNTTRSVLGTGDQTVPPTPAGYRSWCDRVLYIYSDYWVNRNTGPSQNGGFDQAGQAYTFQAQVDYFAAANSWTAETTGFISAAAPTMGYQGAFTKPQYYNMMAIVLRGVDVAQRTPTMPNVAGKINWDTGAVTWGPAYDTDVSAICAPVASHGGWLQIRTIQWGNDHNVYLDNRTSGVPLNIAKLDPQTGLLCAPLNIAPDGTNFNGLAGNVGQDYCLIYTPGMSTGDYRLSHWNDTNNPPTLGPISHIDQTYWSTGGQGGFATIFGLLQGSVVGGVGNLQYEASDNTYPFASYHLVGFAFDSGALIITGPASVPWTIPADEVGYQNAGGWSTWGGNGYPILGVTRPANGWVTRDWHLLTGQPSSTSRGNLVTMYTHSFTLDTTTGAPVEVGTRAGPFDPALMNTNYPYACATVAQMDGYGNHLWVFYDRNNQYLWATVAPPELHQWSIGEMRLSTAT